MRHLWGLIGAIGVLGLVFFGTLGLLAAVSHEPTGVMALAALGSGALLVIAVIARGEGSGALAKTRRVIGGVGLVVAPVTGFLTLLALVIEPSAVPGFLLVTLVAMVAWAQGIAADVGLSIGVSFTWLTVLALLATVVLAVGGVMVAVLVGGLGWDSETGTRLAFVGVLSLIGIVLGAWVRGRPDRKRLPRAVGLAALGRAHPADIELLAAGPRPILHRRPAADDRPSFPDLEPTDGEAGPPDH